MLLVIDVGNTNTVLGLFEGERLTHHWRLCTLRDRTTDEYGALCRHLFSIENIDPREVDAIAMASVVPPLNHTMRRMCRKYFSQEPLCVTPSMNLGMPVLCHPPEDVGADRIINGIAAFHKYGGPVIVVDFGTATTFDLVSVQGEYLGGVIAPGILASSEALFQRTAKLPRVEIRRPDKVVGDSTVSSLQSGLFYGYVGLVDGILKRMRGEYPEAKVTATGGLARLIGHNSEYIQEIDEFLTLEGLRLFYLRCQTLTHKEE